jgi:dihydrofolate reductase
MKIACIAALSENDVIGKDNQLPWHLPADLAFFKRNTYYCDVITGRKSYESVGGPLPGRPTIVLTRQADFEIPRGVRKAASLEEALEMVQGKKQVFILGGEDVFREAIDKGIATHLVLTRVHANVEGDVFFPKWDETQWAKTWEQHHPADEHNAHAMTFEVWERK